MTEGVTINTATNEVTFSGQAQDTVIIQFDGPSGPTGPLGPTGPVGGLGPTGPNGVDASLDLSVITVSATSYSVSASDRAKLIETTSAAATTITLPNNLAAGFNTMVCQAGTGQVAFAAASGATIRNADGLTKTRTQWSEVAMRVRANTTGTAAEYVISGDTSA